MKRYIIIFLIIAPAWSAETPFKRGVNLTSWFQVSSAQQIQFTRFTKQDLINIKSLGCDVIRLPINLHSMTNGEPDYTIEPLFFYFLDQVIDWTEELELHLILDNHSFDPAIDTEPNIVDILIPVWTQMAEHYKERSNLVYYEVLNEPHGISDQIWNNIQQQVIEAIRQVDQKHIVVVGPASWNTYYNLNLMPEYEDDNLIYTFHFYDPFLFTHQGATWTGPSMELVAGVPFPYDAERMPDCPQQLEGSWIESNYVSYRNQGNVARVKYLINIAVDFQTTRDVPLFCGEFGVYRPNSDNEDRVYWYEVVRNYLEEKGIAWTIWDYQGGFGLFEKGTSELFDYDLNIPLIEALGLTAPPQQKFVITPDVNGFDLYLDYIAPNIVNTSWQNEGPLDLYCQDNPAEGEFCINWAGVNQYSCLAFGFSPAKDISVLVDDGYAIDFWIRCDQANAQIDMRFVDTKTDDPDDHPWRIRYKIDRNTAVLNGQWNHMQIPLNAFTEHGSWDDAWYNPQGKFDWAAIDRFEFVAEYNGLEEIQFFFDNIRIIDPYQVDAETNLEIQ
jgi:endoglucanase